MKKLTIILAFTLLPAVMFGQFNPPGCTDLTVENIQMDNDTANLMKIIISNSCTNCSSGINGCVYLELQVVKTIFPFDTIAASNCWCFLSPDNSSQKIYSINSTITVIPPLNDIRVSLYAGGCGCDTIPFSPALEVSPDQIPASVHVSPNPFFDDLSISVHKQNAKETTFLIRNIIGQTVFSEKANALSMNYKKTLDLGSLENGIYVLDVIIDGDQVVKKIVKE
jgi:hypothetical protein